jgi:hypothetical protein
MGTLHEDLCAFMKIFCWILLRMGNLSDKSCSENQNRHFMFNNFVYPKRVPFMIQCGKMWYNQKGHRRKYNTACALCMLDNEGYRHTLKISILIAFPRQQWLGECASTLRLFVHCLSCFSSQSSNKKPMKKEAYFSSKKALLLISMQKVVL